MFPILKKHYDGKYIELDFSQNLSLWPKDEIQSAHFSGKQFTLHCTESEPAQYRYHFHISDDTKHDPLFVDYVDRDIIEKYGIRDENLCIQNDNAHSQYKNKHVFRFYKKLADEFNLRIIRTYGAAGHGKGVIDAISSFGTKNILRHDIATLDVFFSSNESIVDYLARKKPQFSYTNVPADKVELRRFKLKQDPLEIKDCMKQHLFIFEKGKDVLLKEYLCDCNHCLNFKFECCEESKNEGSSEVITDDDLFADEDEELNIEEQIFNFIKVPSYVTLSGADAEILKRGGALCRPPWLASKKKFRFQMF